MKKKALKPVGRRKEQMKLETRALILNSARSLFEEEGYEKTTMRLVAHRAGIGLGTIFKHFPGKSALLAAAFYEDINAVVITAFQDVPGELPMGEQLLHVFSHFYRYYAKRPALSKELLKKILFIEDNEWNQQLAGQVATLTTKLGELLRQGQNRGELRPEVNCETAAFSFFAQYLFVLLTCFNLPQFDPDQALNMLEIFVKNLFKGVGLCDQAPHDPSKGDRP